MEGLSDEALIRRAKQGDVDVFMELAEKYKTRIYQTIFMMTMNHSDADDLSQETFMHAFKYLSKFKQKSSFYTWLYRIAVNLTLNFLKKKNREKTKMPFLQEQALSKEDVKYRQISPEKQSLRKELRQNLEDAIHSLPVTYRTAFILVVLQDMSHGQTAKILKCSENTISWRMHQARKMLQERLSSYFRRGENDVS